MKLSRYTLEPLVFAFIGIIFPFYAVYWIYSNFNLVSLLFLFLAVTLISTNRSIFAHRAWCHKSWTPNYSLNILGQILFVLGVAGNSIVFTSVHRKHHRYSDLPQDPHSPKHQGIIRVLFLLSQVDVEIKYAIDHLKDSTHIWFAKYYWHIIFLFAIVLYLIHPSLIEFWIAVIGITTIKMNLVNVLGHKNLETNAPIMASIFLDGEFWHANHHREPKSWKFSNKWYQIDLGASTVSLFCKLGLATRNRT